ncbi:MAG: TrpB-like pyridoxal phosphate-dependent enzyme [Armatimonadetes bacterium CG_4_8_14_3_um_filter_66_20]|nr:MAG: TrpB-like pyridoxal phosphate-dependent enzyme [Armatimonadetes bacterium CG_4_8_14_3_um_filter_66_20]
MSDDTKIFLSESEMPQQWYNVQADLPSPVPPCLHPGTGQPLTPPDLMPLFPMGLIMQEVSQERWIDIPDPVLDLYKLWRPSPLVRARRLEKALGTPARIYYKNEGVSPAGSHKPNTAVAQAYYNKEEGISRLTTETGAGQWGSALSFACNVFDLKCTVYMVKVSYQQKPYRRSLIQTWGAEVFASPTDRTNAGRGILEKNPDSLGSLGIAISEAVEDAATHDDAHYSLGSVLNHVLLHQTIIGEEALKQMAIAGDFPDVVIGCTGGGSNFAGLALPFVREKFAGRDIRLIAAEPTACPSITRGKYAYDFGDTVQTAPLAKMHTLGHTFVPAGIHAGGLRYHGMAPLVSKLVDDGVVEAVSFSQNPVFDAAVLFAKTEGHIPAPETAHAIRAVVDEALKCKETGEAKCILFNWSGHGHFDMAAYDAYFAQKLIDCELPQADIDEALTHLPQVGG